MSSDPEFEVLGELGRGAMGVVYRARDKRAGREVALKVVQGGGLSGRRRERFLREGRVTASLTHPGIVKVHSIGELRGQPYLAYELVQGCRTLQEVAPELGMRERIALVADAARALGHAHARGVVHRDVKPDNLLVDKEGRIRVADFGLAAAEGFDRLTKTGEVIGTPGYMAPEQFSPDAGAVGPHTDVWAAGVVLYQLLTDELPFSGLTMLEMAAQVTAGEITPPRALEPKIPRHVETIVLKAMARRGEERFADGTALADDLERYLDGKPILARRARGRGWLALPAALALLALVFVAWSQLPQPTPDPQAAAKTPRARKTPAAKGTGEDAGARRRRERIEVLLREGRFKEARTLAAQADRRLHGLASLLLGETRQARRDLSGSDVLIIDLDEACARLMKDQTVLHGGQAKPLLKHGIPTRSLRSDVRALLASVPKAVAPWGDLARPILGRVQDALAAGATGEMRFYPVPNKDDLEALCKEIIALAPELPSADRARLSLAWFHWIHGKRDPRKPPIRDLMRTDPQSWAAALIPDLQFMAHAFWFMTNPGPERLASGERAVRLTYPPGQDSARLHQTVLTFLCKVTRDLGCAAHWKGETKQAVAWLDKSLDYGRRAVQPHTFVSGDFDRLQLSLTHIARGEPRAARDAARPIKLEPIREYLAVECDLAAGALRAAARRLNRLRSKRLAVLEILTARVHLIALQGDRKRALRILARIKKFLAEGEPINELGVAWRSTKATEAILEGGWWPGKKTK